MKLSDARARQEHRTIEDMLKELCYKAKLEHSNMLADKITVHRFISVKFRHKEFFKQ